MSMLRRPPLFLICARLAGIGVSSVGPCVGPGRLPTGGRRLRSPRRSPVRRSPDGICPSGRQYRQRSPLALDAERPGQGALFCVTAGGRSCLARPARPGADIGRHRADAGQLAVSPNNASGVRSVHSIPITTCGLRRRSCATAIRAAKTGGRPWVATTHPTVRSGRPGIGRGCARTGNASPNAGKEASVAIHQIKAKHALSTAVLLSILAAPSLASGCTDSDLRQW